MGCDIFIDSYIHQLSTIQSCFDTKNFLIVVYHSFPSPTIGNNDCLIFHPYSLPFQLWHIMELYNIGPFYCWVIFYYMSHHPLSTPSPMKQFLVFECKFYFTFLWTWVFNLFGYKTMWMIVGSYSKYMFNFIKTAKLSSKVTIPSCIPTRNEWAGCCFTSVPAFAVVSFKFYLTNLIDMWQDLIFILIWILLTITDHEHDFLCLFSISILSFVKCLYIFCPLFIGLLVFLLLIYRSSSYVLDTNPYSQMVFVNISVPVCGVSLHFLSSVFCRTFFSLNLMRLNWWNFFVDHTSGVIFKNSWPDSKSHRFSFTNALTCVLHLALWSILS